MVEYQTDPSLQPQQVNLTPLLTSMRSSQPVRGQMLVADFDEEDEQSYKLPNPLSCVHLLQTVDGALGAIFPVAKLPMLSAWDHGREERDYHFVTSAVELAEAVSEIDDDPTVAIATPVGLRVRREGNVLVAKCLMSSFTAGLADLVVQTGPDGVDTRLSQETVLKPDGRRFY
jgi:hypothetical protein